MSAARCEVWWAGLGLARSWHLELLDDVERVRRERLRLAADRDRFTTGAALVRLILARWVGLAASVVPVDRTCQSCGEPHGRPVVAGSGVRLSVSHSGEWIVVAASKEAAVGVDVERITDVDIALLEPMVFSAAEIPTELAGAPHGDLCAAAARVDFFRAWTRKEAVVKATGDGLLVPLNQVVVADCAAGHRLIGYPGRPELAAQLVDLEGRDGYAAALAVISDAPVEIAELSAATLLGEQVADS